MEFIDLRSDTVTQPTPEMREAMAIARVGDDVYGEDPTVNHLQEIAAELMGKEAALFVPSGTMGNLAAVLAHCGRGDEVILGSLSHTFLYEAGGISALGGVHSHQISNQADGTLSLEDIQAAIRPEDDHQPPSKLLTLENTHNRCGGAALPNDYMQAVSKLAWDHGLRIHLDGARIFNAAASLGVSALELAAQADSVTFCLSKGLCAPVGSVLCGSKEFIQQAHRIRKQLGGGMRQAGVLAAAGIIALEKMTGRLEEDHVRAQDLAKKLAVIPGLTLDPGSPKTNMVYISVDANFPFAAEAIAEQLKEYGVLVGAVGNRRFRLVTHYWITDEAIQMTAKAFQGVMQASIPKH